MGQTLPIIPVMPIVAIAPLGARSGPARINRVQLIRNMRSNDSKTRRELPYLPIVSRMAALMLLLSLCVRAVGQTAPQFQAINQSGSPAGASDSKVEAYPLTAATREVLTA